MSNIFISTINRLTGRLFDRFSSGDRLAAVGSGKKTVVAKRSKRQRLPSRATHKSSQTIDVTARQSAISALCGFKGTGLTESVAATKDGASTVEGRSLFEDYYNNMYRDQGSYSDMVAILVHYHQYADDSDVSLSLPQYSPSRAVLPYKIRGLVGYGGQGAVYSVMRGRREFVAKLARKAVWTGMTMAEYMIMKDLRHPNVVQVFGALRRGFVMEPVNSDLLRVMKKSSLSPVLKLQIAAGVLDGLAYLHSRDIAHLDVKPSNVLIDGHNTPKLADFGISSRFRQQFGESRLLFKFLGTPAYMAPELLQFKFGGPRGVAMPPVDVWAGGCLLYELATGGLPFGDGDLGAIRQQQVDAATAGFGVPPEVRADRKKNKKVLLLLSVAKQMLNTRPAWRPSAAYMTKTYFRCRK